MHNYAQLAILLSLASALISLGADSKPKLLRFGAFPLLTLSGLVGLYAGVGSLLNALTEKWQVALGLPWLHWHFNLDPLAGFYFSLISLILVAVSIYGPDYIREYERHQRTLSNLGFFTGLFIAGMQLVVIADDAFSFMVAWEVMSVSSYFLVVYEHENSANRRAGLLYLVMAEVGALAILLGFGVLAAYGGGFAFDEMRAGLPPQLWSTVAFTLALVGFGMKAGIVPLHVWLPEAHPVAPSHVSGLMSGVMLKVAVYGFIRFCFDLLPEIQWQWGVVVLIIGSISALAGVLYALMQHNLKRLLAYHSVENIGIIYIGLGLSMIFFGSGFTAGGVIALVAAIYHCINHALFKSLLFLGAGKIIHKTHEHDLERMGGLLKGMPWTGGFFLVACISISGLPPFNGFVSEWLTFQAALQGAALESGVLRAVIPVGAAMLALTGALAAACFVKVFGIAFLGQSRSRRTKHVSEVCRGEVWGQGILAAGCLFFGVFASPIFYVIERIPRTLMSADLPSATLHGWLWLTPAAGKTEIASYGAPMVFLGVGITVALWLCMRYVLRPKGRLKPIRRAGAWDCGFGPLNSRMQYTASSFAMPIRRIFEPVWDIHQKIDRENVEGLPESPKRIHHEIHVEDVSWHKIYQPLIKMVYFYTRQVGRIQTGNVRIYLTYSFVTIVALLWLIS